MKKIILLILVLIASTIFYIREPFFNKSPLNNKPNKQEYNQ